MGKLARVLGVVLVLVLASAGVLFLTDYGLEATVTDKGRDDKPFITATTKLLGMQLRRDLPLNEWSLVSEGNFVVYHIASGHIEVYDHEGGRLLYRD